MTRTSTTNGEFPVYPSSIGFRVDNLHHKVKGLLLLAGYLGPSKFIRHTVLHVNKWRNGSIERIFTYNKNLPEVFPYSEFRYPSV